MPGNFTPSDQLTMAALVVPIIVLVVTVSIDSVEKEDSLQHRTLVGGLGLATIISGFSLIGMAIAGKLIGEANVDTFLYLAGSVFSALMLVVVVIIKETFRGLQNGSRKCVELERRIKKISLFVITLYLSISLFELLTI